MELSFYREPPPELPHPPIPLRILLVVESALVRAWEILRQPLRPGFDLVSAEENRVTGELRQVLCDEVLNRGLVHGFSKKLFVVNRDSKFRNFDGSKTELMPDLCVNIIERPCVAVLSHDGLFIECKPVDAGHSPGSCYCDDGLIRFVRGDYAWTMLEAMMVGYAREGYTIRPKLSKALEDRWATIATRRLPTQCAQSRATRFSEPVCTTEHDRTFEYVESGGQAPPITIRHLWLRRD